ncbi:MAG: hypothetical protein KAR38_16015, partial [Calditrichia bacterium]|nr:hypothetical protein [Calditrichia bacterium]
RNYEYEWGDQWGGSSSDPSDQTYRGPNAFSEPELQAIRDFCNVHQFRAALNYHTYSNLLLYPWGYDNVACEDDDIFASLAAEMTVVNNYTTGRPGDAINYNANGSSDDWMYGEQVTKPKIFAFTPEVGGYSDGFWPSTDRILPLAEENLYMNMYIARAIGETAPAIQNLQIITYGQNNAVDPGETSEITFSFSNRGFEETSGLTAKIVSQDTMINTFENIINLPDVAAFSQSEVTHTLAFQLNYNCDPGEVKNVVLGVFDGEEMVTSDTIAFIVSSVETIYFADNAENGMENWTADSPWGITSAEYYEGGHSFTDSPTGEYADYSDISLTSSVIDLQNVPGAALCYQTKWDIESRYDFAVVEISTNGGSSWNNLRAPNMDAGSGSGVQESG